MPAASLPIARRVQQVTGVDVGDAMVHADEVAAGAASAVGARAFARGPDVFFGAGQLQPGTHQGDLVIAHELAHTVQQRGGSGGVVQAFTAGSPDAAEREANEVARRAVDGGAPMAVSAAPVGIARDTPTTDKDGDGWDDRYKTKKTSTGLTMDKYEGLIGVKGSGLGSVADAHETKGGIQISPVTLSEPELRTIAAASGEPGAEDNAVKYLVDINAAFTTMGIDTVQSQADYLAHAIGETGLATLEEKGAGKRRYAPFIGRGPVQVTWERGYVQALAFLDARGKKLAKQAADAKASGGDSTELEAQAALCAEAVTAIKGDITQAANPKYAFLLSAAHMEDTKAVQATASLGATARFQGNGTADSWVSGGNQGKTWTQSKDAADASGDTSTSADMRSTISRSAIKEKVYAAAYSTLIAKKVQPGQPPAAGGTSGGPPPAAAGAPPAPAATGN